MTKFGEIRPGVLNQDQIVGLKSNVIDNLIEDDVDLSAFDLHLSGEGWEMKVSTKPSCQEDISKICGEYKERGLADNGPWKLETGKTYIFQLQEYLRLPEGEKFFCTGTGKSSIGRADKAYGQQMRLFRHNR